MAAQKHIHPLGTQAKILLSSVFGPYAQDDEFGSRKINPMELYHNQVTRVQGGFSLRMFHRSFGLMMIQANVDAPCTLLDFPTLDQFINEIRKNMRNKVLFQRITNAFRIVYYDLAIRILKQTVRPCRVMPAFPTPP